MNGQQEYMPTKPYFAPNGSTPLDRLRRAVTEKVREVDEETDWAQRTRREGELRAARRELESAELAARRVQQGRVQQQSTARQAGPAGYILSDCGGAYLAVRNVGPSKSQQQMFAEPVAYFETGAATA